MMVPFGKSSVVNSLPVINQIGIAVAIIEGLVVALVDVATDALAAYSVDAVPPPTSESRQLGLNRRPLELAPLFLCHSVTGSNKCPEGIFTRL